MTNHMQNNVDLFKISNNGDELEILNLPVS